MIYIRHWFPITDQSKLIAELSGWTSSPVKFYLRLMAKLGGGGAVYQITITFNEQPIRVRSWSRKAEAVAVAAAADIVHG